MKQNLCCKEARFLRTGRLQKHTGRISVTVVLLLICLTGAVQARNDEGIRRWFIDVGVSGYFSGNDNDFLGGAVHGGYYVSRHSRVSLDVGVYGRNKQIGTFTYYNTGTGEKFYDGKITRAYTVAPFMFSWTYEFDLSEKSHLRVGPTIGGILLSAEDSYKPSDVRGTPGPNSEETEFFAYGARIEFTQDILKRCTINLGYCFFGNSKTTFEIIQLEETAHQIYLTFGWRLGKPR
jgi:hypothetical protein